MPGDSNEAPPLRRYASDSRYNSNDLVSPSARRSLCSCVVNTKPCCSSGGFCPIIVHFDGVSASEAIPLPLRVHLVSLSQTILELVPASRCRAGHRSRASRCECSSRVLPASLTASTQYLHQHHRQHVPNEKRNHDSQQNTLSPHPSAIHHPNKHRIPFRYRGDARMSHPSARPDPS